MSTRINQGVTNSRLSVFSTLRLIAVLTLALPALIFAYAVWRSGHEIEKQANERIEHALDVLQEHSLKSLQTVERAISETNEVLAGMSDEAISHEHTKAMAPLGAAKLETVLRRFLRDRR